MKDFIKTNTVTVLILIATVVLAGIATFTAVRLYQLRVQPVSPSSPNLSGAQGLPSDFSNSNCRLSFTLTLASSTPQPTSTSSASPRASATPNNLGLGGLGSGTPTPKASSSPKITSTPKATATTIASATSIPELPVAGSTLPTIVGIFAAVLLLISAFVLAV